MPMTITEKIIAAHAGVDRVQPGELVEVKVDVVFAHDVTAPLAIETFRKVGVDRVFDNEKIILVADHFVPNKDIESAQQAKVMRDFAREQDIKYYYEVGEAGIGHVLLLEKGFIVPGQIIAGADSHTCTYGVMGAFSVGVGSTDIGVTMATGEMWLRVPPTMRITYNGKPRQWVQGKDLILFTIGQIGVEGALYSTLEFAGETVRELPLYQRITMTNMAVEAGAKNGIIEPDEVTLAYTRERFSLDPVVYMSDTDANYERAIEISVDAIEPQVSIPSSPANAYPVSDVQKMAIDQVFIGSCTNGNLEDLRNAASILKGKTIARGIRLIVIPSTPLIYKMALKEGILETFLNAGAVIGPPCCGPCLGGHMGILAEGEKAVATTNRNFVGRMGHPRSEVYLANPFVAASSAILGRIGGPDDL